jgi:hypothetical protein
MKKLGLLLMLAALCLAYSGGNDRFSAQKKNMGKIRKTPQATAAAAANVRLALTWEAGNSYPYSITPTSDGGYLINAMTWSLGAGDPDMWLLKVDANFQAEWQNTFGGSDYDGWSYCTSQETPDGGYLVYTDTRSFAVASYDLWILKLNAAGQIEWQRTYGTAMADTADGEIQPTEDGGFIVVGTTSLPAATASDIWVLKIDLAGNIAWQRTIGDPALNEYGYSIEQTKDGGYIVGASQQSIPGTSNFRPFVLKLTSTGDIEWQKDFGDRESSAPFLPCARQAADGGYYLEYNSSSQGAGDQDVWVIKLSAAGSIIWQKLFGGAARDLGRNVLPLPDNSCLVLGESLSFNEGSSDIWLFKLDPSGNIQWQKEYGGSDTYEESFVVAPAKDGDYIVTGYTYLGSSSKMLILKVSPSGELGPCGLVRDTSAQVTVATIPAVETAAVSTTTSCLELDTHVTPQPTNESPTLLCWNLNQPPSNVMLSQEMNRSLFIREYYNKLSWSTEPWNDQFALAGYKVYRKEAYDVQYQLLGTLPVTDLSFLDGPVDADKQYIYAVTSVDTQGRESPKSVPVESQ